MPKHVKRRSAKLDPSLRRSNYVLITAASTSIMLLRNPLGTVSLGLLVFGGMLFNDAVAQQASRRVVTILRKIDPQRAVKICGVPGGHDGCRCVCAPFMQASAVTGRGGQAQNYIACGRTRVLLMCYPHMDAARVCAPFSM